VVQKEKGGKGDQPGPMELPDIVDNPSVIPGLEIQDRKSLGEYGPLAEQTANNRREMLKLDSGLKNDVPVKDLLSKFPASEPSSIAPGQMADMVVPFEHGGTKYEMQINAGPEKNEVTYLKQTKGLHATYTAGQLANEVPRDTVMDALKGATTARVQRIQAENARMRNVIGGK